MLGVIAGIIVEYSNVAASPLDQSANNNGDSGTGDTGTTATTSQAAEVWVGGVGVNAIDSCTPSNGFTNFANATKSWSYLFNYYYNTMFGLDKVVTSQGTADCSPTFSSSGNWAGVIATLKASTYYTYTYTYYTTNIAVTLAGPAAGNYTLVYSGTVTINPYPVTVAATSATKTYDGTTTAAGNDVTTMA